MVRVSIKLVRLAIKAQTKSREAERSLELEVGAILCMLRKMLMKWKL